MRQRHWFSCSLVLYALVVGYAWLTLPAHDVPLHFGADGAADRFGSRQETLVFLIVLGIGMTALLGGLAHAVDRGRLPMSLVNIPHKEYWTRSSMQALARRMVAEDLYLVGAATLALLAATGLVIVEAATSPTATATFYPWGAVAVGAYCLLLVGWMIWAYARRYRPPEEDRT